METGHDFRLAFRHVERRAVGFRHAGDEIDHEQRQQRQPEPVQQAALLGLHDVAQVQAAAGHQHADQREAHGDFIGDDLRGGTHRAEKGVFGIGRPAGDDHAVHAHRGQRQDVEQAGVDVGQHQAVGERNHRPGRQGRRDGQHRGEHEQEAVGIGRDDDFLHQQLQGIGDRLQPAARPDAVRPDAHLHVADDLALGKGQVGHAQHQRHQDHDDLDQVVQRRDRRDVFPVFNQQRDRRPASRSQHDRVISQCVW